jgi:hypothetical protein
METGLAGLTILEPAVCARRNRRDIEPVPVPVTMPVAPFGVKVHVPLPKQPYRAGPAAEKPQPAFAERAREAPARELPSASEGRAHAGINSTLDDSYRLRT